MPSPASAAPAVALPESIVPGGTGADGTSASTSTAARFRSIDAAVHGGFAVLLVASLVRYVMRHSPADNVLVLGLAAAACLLYFDVAVLSSRGNREPPGYSAWLQCGPSWSLRRRALPGARSPSSSSAEVH